LLNSIWCSLTVVMLIKSSSLLLNNVHIIFNRKLLKFKVELSQTEIVIISVFSGLMLAFSATFWLQITKVEVYSLQIFITSLIICNTLKLILNRIDKQPNIIGYKMILKEGRLIALLFGLGFSNHLMTVYLLPATILTFFILYGINRDSIKSFLILFLISFSVAAIFYFAMMFRAQMSPPWAYGDPSNIKRLIDHVTAKEYSKYLLDNPDNLLKQGSKLLKMLSFNVSGDSISLGEFGLSLFIGIAGILLTVLLKKELFFYFSLVLIISLATAFSYSIPDINEYFLVAFFIISLSGILPLTLLLQNIRYHKYFKNLLFALLLIFILFQMFTNYSYANRSQFFVIEDYYKATLNSLPENSVLLTDNWESILSPNIYYQNVEKFRTDISVISPSGYILFDWYRRNQNTKFYDSSFFLIPKQNLFVSFDVGYRIINKGILKLQQNYSLIPLKYCYVVGIDTTYYQYTDYGEKIRFSKYITSETEKYIRVLIPTILEHRINYEIRFKKISNAKYDELLKEYPEYKISENTL
ncbi:MAG: protein O-mannosyl-transferase family, partial [Ignavibacterium sp.]